MPIDGPNRTPIDPLKFEKLTELINAHPQHAELSVSFRRLYLEAMLYECKSPQKVLKKLVACLKAHESLKEVEQKMLVLILYLHGAMAQPRLQPKRTCHPYLGKNIKDKKHFAELVDSDYYTCSGVTPEGRPLQWIRHGYYHQKAWSIRTNSPQFWAHIRACIFGGQAAYRLLYDTPFVYNAIYTDEGEAKNLGFNVTFLRTLGKYFAELFPLQACRIVVFGTTQATEIAMRCLRICLKGTNITGVAGCDIETVYPFVKDKSSIPYYMIDEVDIERDGNEGTKFNRKSPGYSWCYKRLVRGGPSIRAAEIFNPEPSDFHDEDDSEEDLEPEEVVTTAPLETIEENEDDDEGW